MKNKIHYKEPKYKTISTYNSFVLEFESLLKRIDQALNEQEQKQRLYPEMDQQRFAQKMSDLKRLRFKLNNLLKLYLNSGPSQWDIIREKVNEAYCDAHTSYHKII